MPTGGCLFSCLPMLRCSLSVFHDVRSILSLFLSYQCSASKVRGGSLILDCHHVPAARKGNVLTGQELAASSEVSAAAFQNPV